MNIRHHIEALAAYYAAINITPEQVQELAHIVDLQDFYYSKWDLEHLRQADDSFHDAICAMSKRSVIMDTLIPLHRKTRLYRRIAFSDKSRAGISLQEHREIFEAIASGNAELAKARTAEHISHAKSHMIKRG